MAELISDLMVETAVVEESLIVEVGTKEEVLDVALAFALDSSTAEAELKRAETLELTSARNETVPVAVAIGAIEIVVVTLLAPP